MCVPCARVRLVPALDTAVENCVPFWRILGEKPLVLHVIDEEQLLFPAIMVQSGAVMDAVGTTTHALPFQLYPELHPN